MNTVLTLQLVMAFFYCLVQFARQEYIQEEYEEAVFDVESRLEWAKTRQSFPFGMKAQLDICSRLLGRAKRLWKENQWQQAYQVARQSQEAMNRAQSIYVSVVGKQRR